MNIKLITLALVTVTANLFAGHSSPYRCKMSGNELEADIIVVGGGAAGCILMSELSAKGQYSVIGIEGGKNLTADPEIEAVGLPALLLAGTGKYKYFWPGWNQSVPMPGLNGRTSDWTTGMVLGGGASINGLYYGRGSNDMYSHWEEISGSSNWSLNNILATFKSLEKYQGTTITPGARGTNGPLSVLQTPTISLLTSTVLVPASQTAFPGIPVITDYNDPSVQNCIAPQAQWFIDPTGTKRASSATAYLNSSVMTPQGQGVNGHKLFMLFDAVAVKIIFDNHGRAKKVQYMQDGQLLEARAKKAVVLAGGINSSKLLQLSGIGPSEVLKNAGIKPVFINENVGKHLQNHPLIFITMLAPAASGIPLGAPYAFTINSVYLPKKGGSASDPRMLQMLMEYIPGAVPLLLVGFDLLTPVSEGSVMIQSDNPFQIAAADDGFYQNPIDLNNMKDTVQVYIKDLINALFPYGCIPFPTDPIVGVIAQGYSDDAVVQYIKNNSNLSLDVHHFVSHCKMAPLNAGGVVDGNTRVYGTKNVYVADNSICPVIPDINTAASAMMIGLRSSEILKEVLKKE
ncbi:MAG: GMC family oxidoreductase [Verrucomicrobia bacterium]|nr:GMC family oxidoreductase [Verrucomicrobiota bacterium]